MTRDVVIVGGGIAGLAAAWRLRHRDVLLLEAGDRLGGRMRSDPCGEYWLNYGAHLFPAPGSLVDRMARECALETVPVTGGMMGLAVGSTILAGGRVETYPLRLPLSLRDRVAFARALFDEPFEWEPDDRGRQDVVGAAQKRLVRDTTDGCLSPAQLASLRTLARSGAGAIKLADAAGISANNGDAGEVLTSALSRDERVVELQSRLERGSVDHSHLSSFWRLAPAALTDSDRRCCWRP